MFPLLVQQLSKKLNENEESERKLSAEEQEEEEEEEADLEEEEDQYADEETDTETTEEEPDFTSGSNYEPASECEEDGDAGDSDVDEVFKSTRLEDIIFLLSDSWPPFLDIEYNKLLYKGQLLTIVA